MHLEGCTIGNGVLIGSGAIVLNGAVVEDEALVGAGALVSGRWSCRRAMALGVPATIKPDASGPSSTSGWAWRSTASGAARYRRAAPALD